MTESRLALIVGIATLLVNIWMAIQGRPKKPGGRHRK